MDITLRTCRTQFASARRWTCRLSCGTHPFQLSVVTPSPLYSWRRGESVYNVGVRGDVWQERSTIVAISPVPALVSERGGGDPGETGPVSVNKHIGGAGVPQVFADPSAIQNGYRTGYPERNGCPGEAGQRNQFRGTDILVSMLIYQKAGPSMRDKV